ncbi:MAG: hypothetical protein R3213_08345 [Flavobacteriaceae bacterium]|nr:hypothetical protein [Flavobacteriaceae bacterium]
MSKKKRSHFHSNALLGSIKLENEILYIKIADREIFWDSSAFRPDPKDTLVVGKNYASSVILEEENLPSGRLIEFPREIIATVKKSKKRFYNVR